MVWKKSPKISWQNRLTTENEFQNACFTKFQDAILWNKKHMKITMQKSNVYCVSRIKSYNLLKWKKQCSWHIKVIWKVTYSPRHVQHRDDAVVEDLTFLHSTGDILCFYSYFVMSKWTFFVIDRSTHKRKVCSV